MLRPLKKRALAEDIRKATLMAASPEERKKFIQQNKPENKTNQSLTSSELKRGGRAHKAEGGRMGVNDPRNPAPGVLMKGRNPEGVHAYSGRSSSPSHREYNLEGKLDRVNGESAPQAKSSFKSFNKGGRAHKLSGGALMNYIGAASKNRDTHAADIGDINERAKTEHKNLGSSAEFRDYANKMSNKRTSGLRLAAEKLAGVAKVPARFSEEPMNRGGRAHRATGGKVGKGKTSINIIISPEGPKGASQTPMGGPPAIPPQLLAAMAGGAGGPPPGMMPPGPPPGAMPPGAGMAGAGGGLGAGPAMNVGRPGMTAPTPPMRKAGGRVGGKAPQASMPAHQEHDYGSGSGLGRLEKRKWPLAK
jgi:hypothetical protein